MEIKGEAKKRSYLILSPKRTLYLFKDGSFAYFAIEHSKVILKAFIRPEQMSRVNTNGRKLDLVTEKKTFHFSFLTDVVAQKWA